MLHLDNKTQQGYLGICISEEFQSKGYAIEAMKLLEIYLHQNTKVNKIILNVLNNNQRAIKFYKKTGFSSGKTLDEFFEQNGLKLKVVEMVKIIK